jgi:hypothetical protein
MANIVDLTQLIAKNVRMQMVKRDISHAHVAFKLKLKDDQVKARLNGKVPFSEDELEMLAPYLDTTFEALHMDLEPATNGKPAQNGQPIERKEPEKTTLSRDRSAVATLIGITDKREDLKQLVAKMFMAKLSGKIEDLGYYLRNNVLMKALKDYEGKATEEEKVVFVDHYLDQYRQYKDDLVSDIDDVVEISLTSNDFEVISAVVMPSEKGRLSQFMNGLLKASCKEEIVDIDKLAGDVEKSISHLQRVKGLLEDYLANEK